MGCDTVTFINLLIGTNLIKFNKKLQSSVQVFLTASMFSFLSFLFSCMASSYGHKKDLQVIRVLIVVAVIVIQVIWTLYQIDTPTSVVLYFYQTPCLQTFVVVNPPPIYYPYL